MGCITTKVIPPWKCPEFIGYRDTHALFCLNQAFYGTCFKLYRPRSMFDMFTDQRAKLCYHAVRLGHGLPSTGLLLPGMSIWLYSAIPLYLGLPDSVFITTSQGRSFMYRYILR